MKKNHSKIDHRSKYASTIFTNIYKNNIWGGKKGEYYSGSGSHNEAISEYAKIATELIVSNKAIQIVEIGCGDFSVTKKILNHLDILGWRYQYMGYDVVKPLITQNIRLFGKDNVQFRLKDSANGKICSGDFLIIRQVLQHLNNRSIAKIVAKFINYKHVLVTEHQASDMYDAIITPNLDKQTDASNRIHQYSGVYLDKPPFNCQSLTKVYSIYEPQASLQASINTFLIPIR